MLQRLILWWLRKWYSVNYRFCMTEAYLASQRGENLMAGEYQTRAAAWELEYWRCGRGLR